MSQAPRDESAGSEAGLARAWREASHDEPPAAMDDAIRAAARKAVHAGPRPAGASPFGGRWRVPLSVAAVLVVMPSRVPIGIMSILVLTIGLGLALFARRELAAPAR